MRVFNSKGCLYCHAVSGFGGKRGPDLTRVGDRRTKNQIIVRVLNGNNISPENLKALTAFLVSRREYGP